MKKNILLFILLFFSNTSYALIIESDKLSTLLDYIEPDTLVVLDIDNTLVHPTEELGSNEWFSHEVETKMIEGFDEITAVYYALPKAFYAEFNITLQPTEPDIPELIQSVLEQNIPVIALSTRSLFIAERTLEQLEKINISFFIPNINPDDLILPMTHPCLYKNGILFGGNNDKGYVLLYFFNIMNYHPKKVIFIDDKVKYLIAVEHALKDSGIEFIGIRYSGCDEKVRNFDPKKSDFQWQAIRKKHIIAENV